MKTWFQLTIAASITLCILTGFIIGFVVGVNQKKSKSGSSSLGKLLDARQRKDWEDGL